MQAGQYHPGFRRALMAMLAAGTCFMMFMTTERCFETADRNNAITMVQALVARPGAPTIPEAIEARHPGLHRDDLRWSATITDGFYGFVHVEASAPTANTGVVYAFDVNLAGNRLHPANELARALLQELGAPSLANAAGGE